jgi:hypothetical protein
VWWDILCRGIRGYGGGVSVSATAGGGIYP